MSNFKSGRHSGACVTAITERLSSLYSEDGVEFSCDLNSECDLSASGADRNDRERRVKFVVDPDDITETEVDLNTNNLIIDRPPDKQYNATGDRAPHRSHFGKLSTHSPPPVGVINRQMGRMQNICDTVTDTTQPIDDSHSKLDLILDDEILNSEELNNEVTDSYSNKSRTSNYIVDSLESAAARLPSAHHTERSALARKRFKTARKSSRSGNSQELDLATNTPLLQSSPSLASSDSGFSSSATISSTGSSCPTLGSSSSLSGAPRKDKSMLSYLVKCLLDYGVCIVDNFMGTRVGERILSDARRCSSKLSAGQLMSAGLQSSAVRGDEIMWLEEGISRDIDAMVKRLDDMILNVSRALGPYHIVSRTKAMIARYPGQGQGYMKHVDNHRQDGRCITCIYYLNQNYNVKTDGGVLRMYPSQLGGDRSINIEPKFDRVIFFWSNHRTPHEVLAAHKERYAVTVWYFDEIERREARERMSLEGVEPKLSQISLVTE